LADHHVPDQQPQDLLTVKDVERLGLGPQTCQEFRERVSESQVSRLVGKSAAHRLNFCVQVLFAAAHLRHSMAQLVQAQQVFLIGGEQTLHLLLDPSQFAAQTLLLIMLVGTRGSRRVNAPVELRLNECGVFQQTHDLGPHNLLEQVHSNRTLVASRLSAEAPSLGARAAVVIDRARSAACAVAE
jgi:hypothetical protein